MSKLSTIGPKTIAKELLNTMRKSEDYALNKYITVDTKEFMKTYGVKKTNLKPLFFYLLRFLNDWKTDPDVSKTVSKGNIIEINPEEKELVIGKKLSVHQYLGMEPEETSDDPDDEETSETPLDTRERSVVSSNINVFKLLGIIEEGLHTLRDEKNIVLSEFIDDDNEVAPIHSEDLKKVVSILNKTTSTLQKEIKIFAMEYDVAL